MSFEILAPHYRWLEFFLAGEKLQRCRTAFLTPSLKAETILIFGEGNGRFLVECRRLFRSAKIVCVDASQNMLRLSRRRLFQNGFDEGNSQFIHADALSWRPPTEAFDLVVTHFFLDCFREDQLDGLVKKIAQAARPNACWLLADFQIPERGLRRMRAQAIHWAMYAFFRLATQLPARRLCVPDPWLGREGFCLRERREWDWGLLRSDLWARV